MNRCFTLHFKLIKCKVNWPCCCGGSSYACDTVHVLKLVNQAPLFPASHTNKLRGGGIWKKKRMPFISSYNRRWLRNKICHLCLEIVATSSSVFKTLNLPLVKCVSDSLVNKRSQRVCGVPLRPPVCEGSTGPTSLTAQQGPARPVLSSHLQ